jgi:stage II sporulation protein D
MVRVGVLGIFHPQELSLSTARSEPLLVSVGGRNLVLEPGPSSAGLKIRAVGTDELLVEWQGRVLHARELRATARNGESAVFALSVPERITRRYAGILTIKSVGGVLVPILSLDLEAAVASAVFAESATSTPLEALKAQAVVARSYYVAGGSRHEDFDFCDLAHCQLFHEPPERDSPASRATRETQGLILSYEEKPVATMFTTSCGGRTRTPAELGLPTGPYPYFAVTCDICHDQPMRWSHSVSPEDAALLEKGEAGRLALARRLGWTAVPSNNFSARQENGQVLLDGIGRGHGIGLCQRGAADMARHGATFREILSHYFPNTKLRTPAASS